MTGSINNCLASIMNLESIFTDKSLKEKAKVSKIADLVATGELTIEELISYADKQQSVDKATCIETIEAATKKSTSIAAESLLAYVSIALKNKEPGIKWESAKVIANIAKAFPDMLDEAVTNLLTNATHEGTVVRWATATALAEIVKLKTDHNKKLVSKLEAFEKAEADGGVKKKYLDALKKIKK